MYTRRELKSLSERKQALLVLIHVQRETIARDLYKTLEPVRLFDEGLALWRLVSGILGKR